jgi:GDA1/CD39 (nucleoside phosphatase) family
MQERPATDATSTSDCFVTPPKPRKINKQRRFGEEPVTQVAPQTVGIVELGGASLQVTYQTQEAIPTAYSMPIQALKRQKCMLFTHSFNGWGREAAMRKVVHGDTSPCLQQGFTSSEGKCPTTRLPHHACITVAQYAPRASAASNAGPDCLHPACDSLVIHGSAPSPSSALCRRAGRR